MKMFSMARAKRHYNHDIGKSYQRGMVNQMNSVRETTIACKRTTHFKIAPPHK